MLLAFKSTGDLGVSKHCFPLSQEDVELPAGGDDIKLEEPREKHRPPVKLRRPVSVRNIACSHSASPYTRTPTKTRPRLAL
jgi:hypothetical protein